jgi:hypothetical protein
MSDGDVNSIPDTELLCRAVRGAKFKIGQPRWTGVSDVFGLGSTYSAQLCRRFGMDPDEIKRSRRK